MDNPFVAGDWKQKYDLAGAMWKPKHKRYIVGSILIHEKQGLIDVESNMYGFINEEDVGDCCRWEKTACLPLLPSPEWINAQDNPREVAIAALERAGIHLCDETGWKWFPFDDGSISFDESPGHEHFRVELCHTDPDLAQYAVDYFKVLKSWADNINWEVK